MRSRHTPSIARVADAWFDRSPVPPHVWPGRVGRSMDLGMRAFLDAEGDKRVSSPLTGKEIKLKSLTGDQYQDDDKAQELLRREYEKWKKQRGKEDSGPDDSGDDAPYQGPKGQGTGTKEQLKRLQDDMVDYAAQDGVPEEVAREMVRGLGVGDTADDVRQVERNLERAMKESVEKRKKDEAAARERADAEAAREQADAEAARAKAKADADAKAKVDAKAKADADEKKRRQDVRQNVVDLDAAVDKAKADLEEAKKAKYDRSGQRDVAVAEAEQNLKDLKREYKDAVRANNELTDQEARETDQKLSADLDAARETLDGASAEVAGAEKNLEAAKASGNASEMARAAKALAAANEARSKAELEHRQADNSLALHRYAEVERMSRVTQQVVDDILSGEDEEPGFVVYDRYGNEQRYNPEPADKVYSYMMGLLGEDAEIHKAEEIEYRQSQYFRAEKGKGSGQSSRDWGDFDWGDSDWGDSDWGDSESTPTSANKPGGGKPNKSKPTKPNKSKPTKPTKSGKPRNPDGSSPGGGDDEDYGPGEFWDSDDGKWGARNQFGVFQRFRDREKAKAFSQRDTTRLAPTKSGKPRNPDGSSLQGLGPGGYGPGEFWSSGSGKWGAKNMNGDYNTFQTQDAARDFSRSRTASSSVAARYLDRVAP